MGILGIFGKKKWAISDVSNNLIHGTLFLLHEFEEDLLYILNHHPNFRVSPQLKHINISGFATTVIAGNLAIVKNCFDSVTSKVLIDHISQEFSATVLGIPPEEGKALIQSVTAKMKSLNHPSKNIQYGMSKGYFHYQDLNQFQPEYFRKMHNPHPMIQKSLDCIMENFIWNWKEIEADYKIG